MIRVGMKLHIVGAHTTALVCNIATTASAPWAVLRMRTQVQKYLGRQLARIKTQ